MVGVDHIICNVLQVPSNFFVIFFSQISPNINCHRIDKLATCITQFVDCGYYRFATDLLGFFDSSLNVIPLRNDIREQRSVFL